MFGDQLLMSGSIKDVCKINVQSKRTLSSQQLSSPPPAYLAKRTGCFQYFPVWRRMKNTSFTTGKDQARSPMSFATNVTVYLVEDHDFRSWWMQSDPTLTGLSVESDERPMPYTKTKREVECNHPLVFFWSCWRAEQTPDMPKDLRSPEIEMRHKPPVITKDKERKSPEKLFGSSARSGSHQLCCLFDEIFKNQIVLELHDANQISWAIILTLTFTWLTALS